MKSLLSAIGHGLKIFFTGAVKVAAAAAPLVEVLFPGVAGLFVSIVTAVGNAETAAIAAGQQSGTGPQKLAFVVASIQQSIQDYEKANGITTPHTQEQITNLANAVVQFLNNLNPPPASNG